MFFKVYVKVKVEGDVMVPGLRFLQCAGCRFDSPLWEGPESWISQRNNDLWQTFETVLALCQSENVQLLFLAGDLFDQEYVQKQTVERIARLLGNLRETRVFIAPGERDPFVTASAYRLTIWPDNVHIFSEGISSVQIPEWKVAVYGSGWTAYQQASPSLLNFQVPQEDSLPFMLLHAEVGSIKNANGFHPILPEHVAASGLAYLALGHQESFSGVQKAGTTLWADSGYLEARSFAESGPHGIIIGEMGVDVPQLEFRELGQRQYVEKILSLSEGHDLEVLKKELLSEFGQEEREKDLFRFKLTGPILQVEAAVQPLQKILATKFRFVEVIYEEENIAAESGILTQAEKRTDDKDGYQTLRDIFVDKLIVRQAMAAENPEQYKHWELVKKICLTALEQGCMDDEN